MILTGALLAPLCGPVILCGHSQHRVVAPRCLDWKYGSLAFSLIFWLLAVQKMHLLTTYGLPNLCTNYFLLFFPFVLTMEHCVQLGSVLFFYLLLSGFTALFLCSQAYLLSFCKGCAEKVSVERTKTSKGRVCMTPFVK